MTDRRAWEQVRPFRQPAWGRRIAKMLPGQGHPGQPAGRTKLLAALRMPPRAKSGGKPRARAPRRTTRPRAFMSPEPGKPELIFHEPCARYFNNPETGAVLWELSGVFDKRVVSSPILAGGLVVAACGSGEGGKFLVAARPGNAPPIGNPNWLTRSGARPPTCPRASVWGQLLFLWSNDGVASCLRAASGEVKSQLGKQFFSFAGLREGSLVRHFHPWRSSGARRVGPLPIAGALCPGRDHPQHAGGGAAACTSIPPNISSASAAIRARMPKE